MTGVSTHWEERLAPSSQGWLMIPGMYGIAAPYWKETAPTLFQGEGPLPRDEVLLRAGMESVAFLATDIIDQLRTIPDLPFEQITAAGGAARPPLLQFQADLLGLPVLHSSLADATALGCAFLTGLETGFWRGPSEIQALLQVDRTFHPRTSPSERERLIGRWHALLRSQGIRD